MILIISRATCCAVSCYFWEAKDNYRSHGRSFWEELMTPPPHEARSSSVYAPEGIIFTYTTSPEADIYSLLIPVESAVDALCDGADTSDAMDHQYLCLPLEKPPPLKILLPRNMWQCLYVAMFILFFSGTRSSLNHAPSSHV